MIAYPYDIQATFPNGLNLNVLCGFIKASTIGSLSLGASTEGNTCFIYFELKLTPDQQTVLGQCIALTNSPTTTLQEAKQAKFEQIDKKTNEIIARGYVWEGVVLSLSLPSQTRLNGVYAMQDDPPGGYPIVWNSLDDNSFVTLEDAKDTVSMHDAAGNRLREVVDSGTAIKEEVRAATTVAEVEAIVDPRK